MTQSRRQHARYHGCRIKSTNTHFQHPTVKEERAQRKNGQQIMPRCRDLKEEKLKEFDVKFSKIEDLKFNKYNNYTDVKGLKKSAEKAKKKNKSK